MALFNVVNSFMEALPHKKHGLDVDTLKILLTNTAPVYANTQKSDIVEISGGTGYTTGGLAMTVTESAQSGGLYKLIIEDLLIVATGVLGPFQYAVLFNETSAGDLLIGWMDYGEPVTLQNTNSFRINISEVDGILQIRRAS